VTTRKYPLEPLVRVRATQTDEAERRLALAVRARELAERRLRAAEAERETARAAAQRLRDAERQALEHGELSARDLMRADAWEVRAKEELLELERQLAQASARETEARTNEVQAKRAVAERSAEERVVAEDRVRWADRERKKAEAKEEEEGGEAWRPKRV
jgi:hypothetical protein